MPILISTVVIRLLQELDRGLSAASKLFKGSYIGLLLILFYIISGYNFLSAQNKNTLTKQQISKTFITETGAHVRLNSLLPIRLQVKSNPKEQVDLSVSLEGENVSIDADQINLPAAGQTAATQLITISILPAQAQNKAYLTSSLVTLLLPSNVISHLTLSSGQVELTRLTSELSLELGQGDLKISQCENRMNVFLHQGSLQCEKSQLEGQLSVQSGILKVTQSGGHLSLHGPSAQFTINATGSMVESLLERGNNTLTVQAADVQASLEKSKLDFRWLGDKNSTGHKLDFIAHESELYLRLPSDFSAELLVDQSDQAADTQVPDTQVADLQTEPATDVSSLSTKAATNTAVDHPKTARLESDFQLLLPAPKEITYQGKKVRLVQSSQVLGTANANGRRDHQMSLHMNNSSVYLKYRQ
ncbi:hypothetical protein [Xanthocytophaga flava]|uniref:hypothetical protein n=1 Tax=Xanthocytophaga flava TaxID=3048013 RepID=UPI0028D899DC|nr:hypothetical protein [Xanthocytophaga flavus]MDJ1470202.1 hypothetical protein [Xanthocytophaga flavus]